MPSFIDLAGRRFGRWQVLSPHRPEGQAEQLFWLCVCDCGTARAVNGGSLRRGLSASWDAPSENLRSSASRSMGTGAPAPAGQRRIMLGRISSRAALIQTKAAIQSTAAGALRSASAGLISATSWQNGREARKSLARPHRRERELRAGQLPLGHTFGAGAKPASLHPVARTSRRLSEVNRGRMPVEAIAANRHRVWTAETRAKISAVHRGKTLSPQTIAKRTATFKATASPASAKRPNPTRTRKPTMSDTYQANADPIQGARAIRTNPALLAALMSPPTAAPSSDDPNVAALATHNEPGAQGGKSARGASRALPWLLRLRRLRCRCLRSAPATLRR